MGRLRSSEVEEQGSKPGATVPVANLSSGTSLVP